MKRIYLFLLINSILVSNSYSQDWAVDMQNSGGNFYNIQQNFNDYWSTRDNTEKGKGYKAFKRWENFVELRVFPSGELAQLGQTGKNFADWYAIYKQQNNNNGGGKFGEINQGNLITSTTWTAIGPMGPIVGTGNGQNLKSGRINGVVTHPTNTLNLFACAPAGGLWRSYDAGATWVTNTDNLPIIGCTDMAINSLSPNIMYLATGDGDAGDTRSIGVLKSTDAGLTWANTGLTNVVTNNFLIRRIIIDPTNPQLLMVASNSGIRRTTDAAVTWANVLNVNMYDLEFQPGNSSVVYGAGATFRRSSDGGATWTMISAGIPTTGINRMAIAVTPANPSVVYVLASNSSGSGFQGLYRSLDAGVTFSLMASTPNLLGWATAGNDTGGQGWYDLCIAASPTNSNEIITGGVNVWRSTDGGTTWAIYGHWTGSGAPFTHADHHDLEYDIAGNLYDTNDGTIYRRNGATWQEVSGTMNISQIYKVGASALTANLWISGHQDNGTSIYTAGTYSAQLGGDGMDCFIDRTNNSNKFAEYYSGSFMRSIGGGAYSSCTSGMTGSAPWVTIWKQDPQNATRLYAGRQEMFVSNNLAGAWTQLAALPSAGSVVEFAIAPSNNQVIYVLKSNAVIKTTDGGATWTSVTGTLPVGSASLKNLTIDPNDPNNVWVVFSGYSAGNKVFVTTNGGTTWTNYTSNLPNIPANCAIYQSCTNDRIYVGMDVGVYYRDNTQATWTLYNTGLPNTPVSDFEISAADPTRLIASTYGRGMWRVDLIPNNAPVTSFTTPAAFCVNTTYSLTDLSTNSPSSWAWSVSPATGFTLTSPGSQNPNITFGTAGNYTLTLVASNTICTGTTYTQAITVSTNPTVTVNSASVCSGVAAALSASGAATYSWDNGATSSSISVTPSITTVYTVTGYNGGCFASNTSTVTITTSPTISITNSVQSICSGTIVNITANGATTYTWDTGANTASIAVGPSVTTIYTVTGTANGCTATAASATVNVTPSPTLIVNNPAVCSGNAATLNATGATNYTWSTGANTNSISVSPSVTTVYTVSGSNGSCAGAVTSTVTINITPTVVINNSVIPICSGASASISASGAPAYLWNTGSSSSLIVVSPTTTASYTVTGLNGACTDVKTATVNVTQTPTVSASNAVICNGNSAVLTASGAISYTWNNGSNTSSTSVTPSITTNYTVTGFNGTCSNNFVTTVTVNPLPNIVAVANESLICRGNSLTLTATGGVTYTWQPGNLNGSPVSLVPTVSQVYTVSGTDANNCSSSQTIEITVSPCTGILKSGNESIVFSVFPNPASEKITIYYPSNSPTEIRAEVLNAEGKLVVSKTYVFSKNDSSYSIDISSVAKGVYFLKLYPKEGEAKTLKLIKE